MQKPLSLSHLILVPKATISCFKKDFCIRNFNCYTIDGFTDRVTDETSIVETAVWPIPFLINVFAALKGSKF